MANLPYVTAPGNIERALIGIKTAAVPEKVSGDFVKTILLIKGGSGDQMTSFLKKVGFANADGSPSEIYKRFRNPVSSGSAAAEALRVGYGPLFLRNEYMYKLNDEALKGLILEETGMGEDSSAVGLTLTAIKSLRKFADFDQAARTTAITPATIPATEQPIRNEGAGSNQGQKHVGMNLGYNINLNLPATSDPAVFNAIFKALKENLLESD